MTLTLKIHENGVHELAPTDPRATVCGHCGRGWDDNVVTGITPAPSARCPFEYDHEYPESDTYASDLDRVLNEADDHELAAIEEVMVRVGLLIRCESCGWVDRPGEAEHASDCDA